MNKRNSIILTIFVLFIGALITTGTYAFWSWTSSNNKTVLFNVAKNLREYIEYDSGESKFVGDFNVSETFTGGIHTTISIKKKDDAPNVNMVATINMDINEIGANMAQSSALKWVVTSGSATPTGSILSQGNFMGASAGDTLTLLTSIPVTTTKQDFTIWIWIDTNEHPSEALSGETLDTTVWTQIDQMEGEEAVYEITRLTANYQTLSATVINNRHKITSYAIINSASGITSWDNIPSENKHTISANNQNNVYNLVDSESVTTSGTYDVWFIDEANNPIHDSVVVTAVDSTAPSCSFDSFSPNTIKDNQTATINLTCTDSESPITISTITKDNLTTSSTVVTITNVTKATITNGYQYTITVKGTVNDGTSTITLPANTIRNTMGLGNEIITSSASVTVKNTIDLSGATVTLSETTYTYDGSAKTPTATVIVDGVTLTLNTDYTIAYSNNVNAGTATVTITGINDYEGTTSKTFTINKATVTVPTVAYCKSLTYTGSNQTLVNNPATGFAWTTSTSAIDAGSNYTVTASLTNTSNYKWSDDSIITKTVTCSISPKQVAVTWQDVNSLAYTGSSIAPTVTTPVNGVTGESLNLTRTMYVTTGSHLSTATCDSVTGGQAKCSNYTLTNNTKQFNIIPSPVPIPEANDYCKSLTYNGTTQTLVNTAGTGFTWSAGTTGSSAGSYTVTASLTDSVNYEWTDNSTGVKTITCSIAKAVCNPPSNIAISTSGIVTWNNSSNADSYEISIDNSIYTSATSGVNYNSTITGAAGNRTVYLRSVCDSINYHTPSSSISTSVSVYTVTLTNGTGISATSGGGKYIAGSTVNINASVSSGYTWLNWTQTSGGTAVSTTKAYSATINGNWAYTANAFENVYELQDSSSSTTGYADSLSMAFSNVPDNGKIIALKNNTSSASAANNKNVTLDTNGETITLNGTAITNSSTLKIIGGGTITGTASTNYVIINNSGASLTTSSVTLSKTDTIAVIRNSGTYTASIGTQIINNSGHGITHFMGTINLTAGTIQTSGYGIVHSGSWSGVGNTTINISGGLIASGDRGIQYSQNTTNTLMLSMSGGTVSASIFGMHITTPASMTITGGTVISTGATAAVYINTASATLTLGTKNNVVANSPTIITASGNYAVQAVSGTWKWYDGILYGSRNDGNYTPNPNDTETGYTPKTIADNTYSGGYKSYLSNVYTVRFDDNRFNATNKTEGGLTISYDSTNHELTLNGTQTSGVNFQLIPHNFVENETYEIIATYVSGSITRTNSSVNYLICDELKKEGGAALTTLFQICLRPPSADSVTSYKTITAEAASEGKTLRSWIWAASANVVTYTNYKVKLDSTKRENKEVTYNTTYGTLPTPTGKAGYTFDGWYTAESGGTKILASTTMTTASNHTLYARWTPATYTITYYQGNGTNDPGVTQLSTTTCTYGQSCTLTSYSNLGTTFPLTSANWSFSGWSTSQTGTDRTYSDGQNFTYSLTQNLNLYAVGQKVFNFSSGIAPTTHTDDIYEYWNPYSRSTDYVTEILIPNPTNINTWTFDGYRAVNDLGVTPAFAASLAGTNYKVGPADVAYTEYRSLYHRTITLSYNANGGTGTAPSSATMTQYYNSGWGYGTYNAGANLSSVSFTLAANPFTKTGYTFNGWAESTTATSGSAAGTVYSFKPAVDNTTVTRTLYASWLGNLYTASFYYQSHATAGSTTATVTTASCRVTSGTSCNATIPSAVRSSVGTWNNAYAGLSASAGNMTEAVASSATVVSLTSDKSYYSLYRTAVTVYRPSTTAACTTTNYYRNQWFSSNTALTATILSTSATGTSNVTPSVVSGYTFYRLTTGASNSGTAYTVATAASTTTATFWAREYVSVVATFKYSSGSTGTVSSTTASNNRHLYCTAATTATITAPTITPTLTHAPPYGTTFVGWATGINTMATTTANTNNTAYYAVYRNPNITVYRPNSTAACTTQTMYRNSYMNATGATAYTTVLTTTSASIGNTAPSVVSGYTFYRLTTAASNGGTTYTTAQAAVTTTTSFWAREYVPVVATFKYSGSTTGAVSSTTASANRHLYCTAATTATITAPTITPTLTHAPPYGTTFVGWATGASTMATTTANTNNTAYYAVYRSSVSVYRPSNATTCAAQTMYRNTFMNKTNATTYTTVLTTTSASTANTNPTIVSGYSLTGYAKAYATNTTTYANTAALATTATTVAYVVSSKVVTASFYYYTGATQAVTTATATQYLRCKTNTVAELYNNNLTVPSAASTNRSTYTYKGVATATGSTGTGTPTTATVKYYSVYRNDTGLKATFSKGTGISSIGSASATCYNYFLTNGTTYTNRGCTVTLPTITLIGGYTNPKWYVGTSNTVAGTAGASVSMTAASTYTAKGTPSSYSATIGVSDSLISSSSLNGWTHVADSGKLTKTITNGTAVTLPVLQPAYNFNAGADYGYGICYYRGIRYKNSSNTWQTIFIWNQYDCDIYGYDCENTGNRTYTITPNVAGITDANGNWALTGNTVFSPEYTCIWPD